MKKENQIIICPGSINPDFIIRSDSRLKLANRTMTFNGKSSVYKGGKGRSQAVAAKRASAKGTKVVLVGCTGKDALGRQAIEHMKKQGIETSLIKQTSAMETGKCILSIFKGGYQIVGLDLAANTLLSPKDIYKARSHIASSKVLVCQIENSIQATAYALKLAKGMGCFTILNPSIVPANVNYVRGNIYPYVDMICLNLQEAEQLLGRKMNISGLVAAAKKLSSEGPKYVIITIGDKGCIAYHANRYSFVKAVPVKEIDTTACGDVFVGSLSASVLEKLKEGCHLEYDDFLYATRFANAAAALSVTKIGASESAPNRMEIIRELRNLR